MKSKTSLCNTALLKKNLQRFWPVALIYFLYLFFALPFNAFSQLKDASADKRIGILAEIVGFKLHFGWIVFFAFIAAVLVFFYLFQTRSGYMMHAFPISRKELFCTNVISGLLLLYVPQLAAGLLLLPSLIPAGAGLMFVYWILYSFGMTLIFFAIAVLSCHLSGHAFATMVYYIFFLAVYPAVRIIIQTITAVFGYGMSQSSDASVLAASPLSPVTYLGINCGIEETYDKAWDVTGYAFTGPVKFGCYVIAAVILLVIAYQLYRRRAIETAGEMSAFAFIRPVIRWTITFGVPVFFAMCVTDVGGFDSFAVFLVLYVIFAIFCFLFTEMVLKKNFRILTRKLVAECAACIVIFGLLFTGIHMDAFRLQRHIPQTDEIAEVTLDGGTITISDSDPETITAIRQIHEKMIENKAAYTDYMKQRNAADDYDAQAEYPFTDLRIRYQLKNGKTLIRSYELPLSESVIADRDSALAILDQLESDPQRNIDYYLPAVSEAERITGYFINQSLNEDQTRALEEAWKRDVLEGRAIYHTKQNANPDQEDVFSIDVYYSIPAAGHDPDQLSSCSQAYAEGDPYDDSLLNISSCILFRKNCTETIQTMIDLGIIRSEADLFTMMDAE